MKPAVTALIAAVMAAAAHNVASARRVYLDPFELSDGERTLARFDSQTESSLRIDLRGHLRGNRPVSGASSKYWGITFGDGYRLTLRSYNESFATMADISFTDITITRGDSVVASARDDRHFSTDGYNSLTLRITNDGGVTVRGGEALETGIFDTRVEGVAGEVGLFARGTLDVAVAVTDATPDRRIELASGLTTGEVTARARASADRTEGLWEALDRNNDPRYARQGGRYSLATVRNDSGSYDIIYLGGAEVNPAFWRPGMVKGRLTPTIFIDSFDLEWFDSQGESVTPRDCHARIEQGAILVLEFPLLKTTLRFSRRRAMDK